MVRLDLSQGDPGYEACDDGNDDDSDSCLAGCVAARCGDGVVGPNEGCDDGNDDPTDACNNCVPASCGDGVVQVGELCDDGNADDLDGCRNTCAPARCGDGAVRTDREYGEPGYERCDDGNRDPSDDCTNACEVALPIAFSTLELRSAMMEMSPRLTLVLRIAPWLAAAMVRFGKVVKNATMATRSMTTIAATPASQCVAVMASLLRGSRLATTAIMTTLTAA